MSIALPIKYATCSDPGNQNNNFGQEGPDPCCQVFNINGKKGYPTFPVPILPDPFSSFVTNNTGFFIFKNSTNSITYNLNVNFKLAFCPENFAPDTYSVDLIGYDGTKIRIVNPTFVRLDLGGNPNPTLEGTTLHTFSPNVSYWFAVNTSNIVTRIGMKYVGEVSFTQ